MARQHVVSIRIADAGLAAVDKIAAEEQRKRSDMCRILLAEAVAARAKQAREVTDMPRIIDVNVNPRLERMPQVGDVIYINDTPCRVDAVEPVGVEAPDKFEVSVYVVGPKRTAEA